MFISTSIRKLIKPVVIYVNICIEENLLHCKKFDFILVFNKLFIKFIFSDHVIIHVPYHIKTIKHTHTITKHIHHKDNGDGDKFELLGYTYGHPIDLGGHGGNNVGAWSNDYGGYELGSEHVRGHEGY